MKDFTQFAERPKRPPGAPRPSHVRDQGRGLLSLPLGGNPNLVDRLIAQAIDLYPDKGPWQREQRDGLEPVVR